MESVSTIAALRGQLAGRRVLVCFWKRGCPACMAVSKVIDLLSSPDCAVLGFDCTDGMDEARALGVPAAPHWLLFEQGEKTAEIRPTSGGEALHRFLTGQAGFDLPELIMEVALEDGRAYARSVQAALAEALFRRADSDRDTLVDAARLMILKACVGDAQPGACVDGQIARCVRRLEESDAWADSTQEERRRAAERLPGERDRLVRELEALLART